MGGFRRAGGAKKGGIMRLGGYGRGGREGVVHLIDPKYTPICDDNY